MKDKSLVSIITPVYNAEDFLAKTLYSVVRQTYPYWELLAIDDNSSDNSLSILKNIAAEEHRIRIVHLDQNKGAAYCRNLATEMAKGTYIAFLDADDLWFFNKLETQVAFMQKHQCMVSYTSYLHIDEQGKSLKKLIEALPVLSYQKQYLNNYIGNLTGMYNAEKLGKILSPPIRKRQDWAVWLEALKRSKKPALGIAKCLACYRIRKTAMSANKLNLIKYNYLFYRSHLGHSTLRSFFFLLRFFVAYFFIRPKQFKKTTQLPPIT